MTGGYLASQIRQWRIRPIIAFRECIFRDVVPQFGRLNERADQIGNEYFEAAINQPAGEDCDGDLSGFAEDVRVHSWRVYVKRDPAVRVSQVLSRSPHVQQLAAPELKRRGEPR